MKRRVVVTGIGIVSPAGAGRDAFWSSLVAGRSCVTPITRFDASSFPTRIAAAVDESVLDADPSLDRITRFALDACGQAVRDASLDEVSRSRVGTVVATGMGSYDHAEVFGSCAAAALGDGSFDWSRFVDVLKRELRPRAAERRSPGSVPALIARRYALEGPAMAVMTACAGGTQALGDAMRWIRRGDADAVIAGASDSELYPMGVASFSLLGALSRRNDAPAKASRPFDAGRDGFVIGEGAAFLVLEEMQHALRRGARVYAEMAGFGSASDAYRVTDPHPDGAGAILAMQRALDDGGIGPGEVDYINAHGTSTVANDAIETRAIRQLFGDHAARIAVSSTKSMIGHLTVAAGAAEAVAVVLSLRNGMLHPTVNLETPDPACDLDYVPNVARKTDVRVALSNSFAFGGQCAAVAVRRFEETR